MVTGADVVCPPTSSVATAVSVCDPDGGVAPCKYVGGGAVLPELDGAAEELDPGDGTVGVHGIGSGW